MLMCRWALCQTVHASVEHGPAGDRPGVSVTCLVSVRVSVSLRLSYRCRETEGGDIFSTIQLTIRLLPFVFLSCRVPGLAGSESGPARQTLCKDERRAVLARLGLEASGKGAPSPSPSPSLQMQDSVGFRHSCPRPPSTLMRSHACAPLPLTSSPYPRSKPECDHTLLNTCSRLKCKTGVSQHSCH